MLRRVVRVVVVLFERITRHWSGLKAQCERMFPTSRLRTDTRHVQRVFDSSGKETRLGRRKLARGQ